MDTDLISNDFVGNVNKNILKRNLRLMNIVIILVIVYTITEITTWYFVLKQSQSFPQNAAVIFDYKIRPFINALILISGILSWSFTFKANKLILTSFEKNDAEYFNKGYQLFFASSCLVVAAYIISIATLLIQLYLNNKIYN